MDQGIRTRFTFVFTRQLNRNSEQISIILYVLFGFFVGLSRLLSFFLYFSIIICCAAHTDTTAHHLTDKNKK